MIRSLGCSILAAAALSGCSSKSAGPGKAADGKVAQYQLANGKTVDCVALRAAPPGEVLAHVMRLSQDPADGQAALETCMADGPHVCDRAWVGWAIFGGLSMAVVDGVAPPPNQRARWFGDACRAMTPTDQACLLMSKRLAEGGWTATNICNAPMDRMRSALGHAQMADDAARGRPVPDR